MYEPYEIVFITLLVNRTENIIADLLANTHVLECWCKSAFLKLGPGHMSGDFVVVMHFSLSDSNHC